MEALEHKDLLVSDFELKEDGDEQGTFTGYGSTFGGKPDSHGDIVDPGAFTRTLKKNGATGLGVAMLWIHNTDRPIGTYPELAEDQKGLKVKGKIAIDTDDGRNMFGLMKAEAVKALSIGFRAVVEEWDNDSGIRHLKDVDLFEISPVVFPANTRAKIGGVKSAILDAGNVRDLERALRESGLTRGEAIAIVKNIDDRFYRREAKTDTGLREILRQLQDTRKVFQPN